MTQADRKVTSPPRGARAAKKPAPYGHVMRVSTETFRRIKRAQASLYGGETIPTVSEVIDVALNCLETSGLKKGRKNGKP
jgi:hypothetical protein